MINISRRNVREIRSTIRQSLGITSVRRFPAITLRATGDQLRIQTATNTVAIDIQLPHDGPAECTAIPYAALLACEGRQEDLVSFVPQDDAVVLQWSEAGIPQSASVTAAEPVTMPAEPTQWTPIEPGFLTAMADAVATTETTAGRYALDCVRLRGCDGQMAATDSKQALIHTGFSFPWDDDVLVTASEAFLSHEFSTVEEVQLGRSEDWVAVKVPARTLYLKIDKERRFPNIDLQIPAAGAVTATVSFADDDAEFLVSSAKHLPGAGEPNAPVTVELNGAVAVRAASEGRADVTELVLSNSRRSGDEIRFSTNRKFLVRASQLGFREIQLRSSTAPAYCHDDRRTYIWALLDEDAAIKASTQMTRINAPVISKSLNPPSGTKTSMIKAKPAKTNAEPSAVTSAPDSDATPNLLTQAETLRESLSKALTDTRELISIIKRHQKQNRLVETTLRSLKQLEHIGA